MDYVAYNGRADSHRVTILGSRDLGNCDGANFGVACSGGCSGYFRRSRRRILSVEICRVEVPSVNGVVHFPCDPIETLVLFRRSSLATISVDSIAAFEELPSRPCDSGYPPRPSRERKL
ncbi:hypothetical protein B296_00029592 [Ensete ventricosum]|uniref:Uncharacterized protein n=1 Tax=Ensete ventricosum TaxID=4639 RepID=A0A426YM82_ENSVE|nr:hypothetical protein B296_00029592 [Ensete ventricosum]